MFALPAGRLTPFGAAAVAPGGAVAPHPPPLGTGPPTTFKIGDGTWKRLDNNQYQTPSGVVIDKNLISVDHASLREKIPDPQGRPGKPMDPNMPYGSKYTSEFITRIQNFTQEPLYRFITTAAGVCGLKNPFLASDFGNSIESMASSLTGLYKILEEAQLGSKSQASGSGTSGNKVTVVSNAMPLDATEKKAIKDLYEAKNTAGDLLPAPNFTGIPATGIPAVFPHIQPPDFTSADSIIRYYLNTGRLDKNVLDAVDRLFPKVEPTVSSIKFSLTPVISGFMMFNHMVTGQANSAVTWLQDELVDPRTQTSPFLEDMEILNPSFLAYLYPEDFGLLVGHLMQQNTMNNGMPATAAAQYSIATCVSRQMNRMLSKITKGKVVVQKSRGARVRISSPMFIDDKRDWLN